MRILALEFSTRWRSAALVEEGQVIAVAREGTPQTVGPTRLIGDVLSQAGAQPGDVECLAVGLGPGSYTGVRVAIAITVS